jgi:dTDP-4-dehydrorhamnose reductase
MGRELEDLTLVLGASGFLGVHLVRLGSAVGASRTAGPGERHERVDLALEGAATALLERVRPARVVNAAACSRVGDAEREPALARRLNREVPGEVAAWCAAHGARLVHVSTDLVFGGAPGRPEGYREEDPVRPCSVYGASKAEGEEEVLAAGGALVVRLPLLFGDSGGRNLGASDSLRAAIERGTRPRLFTDEYRTPLDVGDAARALLELAAGDATGLLHVAGPTRLSRLELGRLVAPADGALEGASRRDLPGWELRPADVSLDAARARALLTRPLRSPAEALSSGPP